ncbi:MAG: cytochrome c [Gammaproteobacteria bacterium]|nr:cytochrome c [Gammaproteobacteria bacterium]
MMRLGLGLIALCGLIGVALLSAQESGDVAAGRQLFNDYQCWQCHGFEGQGGAAPRIAPTLYPFEAFERFVRHTTLMPAYSPNVLSDEQLRHIYAFVRSQPEPPAVEDIPELRNY